MRRLRIASLCMMSVMSFSATPADTTAASAPSWTYVSAYGGTVPWKVKQGAAWVVLSNGALSANMLNDRHEVIETLDGELKSTRVSAKRTVRFSDIEAEQFVGSYKRYVDGTTVYEVITLSNEFGFIGLNRITRGGNAQH